MRDHTPGPFSIDSGAIWAEAKDGIKIKLAQVFPVLNYISIGERNANLELFSAAPELLEACQGLLMAIAMSVSACEYLQPDDGALKAARAAIAKAEGRA